MKESSPSPALQPAAEQERLFVLQSTRLLDTDPSEGFDRITRLAAQHFDVPIAVLTLVDRERQWFKSCIGLDVRETPRAVAFCDYTIRTGAVMVVEDATQDERFRDNPLVTGDPHIRFYAGAPLVTRSGHALGSLCVIDRRPRAFDDAQRRFLADLAALVMAEVDLHRTVGRVNEVTGLFNRAQLAQDLDDLCLIAPGGQRTLALLEVMGDQQVQVAVRAVGIAPLETVLRAIGALIVGAAPAASRFYHVSETRFAYLLADGDPAAQEQELGAMLQRLRAPLQSGGVSVELQVHAGLAPFALLPNTAGDALRCATTALHRSQEQQLPFAWHHAPSDAVHRRAYGLLRAIGPGLARGEFRLVYQPKMNLRTRRFTGVEALIRWQHPRHGNVPPADFIPQVEGTALIHLITEWVLHTSLEQLAAWNAAGLKLTMAVNVSARNLEHPRFLQVLRNACAVYGIEPRCLHVECTENAALTGSTTMGALREIRALGMQVSLDDFGTGYCNLAALRDLPAEMLKLDQSLVRPIATDEQARKLLQYVIAMSQALGYRLLAEGVETQEIFDLVADAGCDYVQGYFLSRPIEAQAVPAFLLAAHAGDATASDISVWPGLRG